ncbi:MAG: XRE family transcriptional regulator [Rhodospirillales bacterium]|nr:XRE family transcriptional regulator [Rhodospirillales bacterium]
MAFTSQGFSRKFRSLCETFGNSIDEVAAATGIGSQALRAIEAGNAPPTGDEVLIIADFFKCEFSWLVDDAAPNPEENASTMLRSEGRGLAASDRHAIAEFLYLCKSQAMLEELLEVRPSHEEFKFVPRGTYFKRHGADCAAELRQKYNLPRNAIIPDIFGWLRDKGFRVFRRALPSSPISGLFVRHPEAGNCILINFSEDKYRQRFSAAHEIGHALLDIEKKYNVSVQIEPSGSNDLVELRANSFASSFLMPPELLSMIGTKEQWRQPEKIREVASQLFVSVPALLSALKRDNILDEDTLNNLRQSGIRLPDKHEPEVRGGLNKKQRDRQLVLLGMGLHSQYVNMGFEAHARGLISQAKLADILLTEPSELTELSALFGVSLKHG